jgi:hypothetical protein
MLLQFFYLFAVILFDPLCMCRPLLQCKFCKSAITINESEDHIEKCEEFVIPCSFNSDGCNVKSARWQIGDHERNCDFASISCKYCEFVLPKNKMTDHENNSCSGFLLDCPNKCGLLIPRKSLKAHCIGDCPNATIQCSQCKNETVLKKAIEDHLKNTCSHSPVFCSIDGCSWRGLRKDLSTHLTEGFDGHQVILLKKVLSEKDYQIASLNEKLGQVNTNHKNLEKKSSVVGNVNSDEKMRSMEVAIITMKAMVTSARDKVEDMVAEKNKWIKIETDLISYKKQLNVSESKRVEAENITMKLNQEIDALKLKMSSMNKDIASAEELNTQLKEEVDTLKSKLSSMNNSLVSMISTSNVQHHSSHNIHAVAEPPLRFVIIYITHYIYIYIV